MDNSLLYALYKSSIDFLITEDLGIHKTAKKFNLEEQVLTLNEAIITLNPKLPFKPTTINKTTVDTLDLKDPLFNTLKDDYHEFNDWFENIVNQERECLTYTEQGNLGALLIYKEEKENITLKNKIIPPKNRVKISTMKVTSEGNKIGEFFISWIVNFAINRGCEEIYLTHFTKGKNDSLVYLIEEYGFEYVGQNSRGEEVFIKKINKDEIISEIKKSNKSISYNAKKYYPYFCDDENIRKFIVPIIPEYHEKLFLKKEVQTKMDSFFEEGYESYPKDLLAVNPIKKAYLSHSKTKLREGDLLLFYETEKQGISNIGIVESIKIVDNLKELLQIISKRSVFSLDELERFIENEVLVILFINSKNYLNKISYDELIDLNIIKGPVQNIQSLNHEKYLILKEKLKEREKQI